MLLVDWQWKGSEQLGENDARATEQAGRIVSPHVVQANDSIAEGHLVLFLAPLLADCAAWPVSPSPVLRAAHAAFGQLAPLLAVPEDAEAELVSREEDLLGGTAAALFWPYRAEL